MAKSYVTKFTEYVAKQRDMLENKLKQKGLTVGPQAPLGELVSQLDLLRDDYVAPTYDRDPNLPNIDEMFDNDPLRAVNGGQYKACCYGLMLVDANGKVGLSYQSSTFKTLRYFAEKIIFSDGTEYDKTTATNFVHTMGESGIYSDSNGVKYAIVKFYKTEPVLLKDYLYLEPFVEQIDDFFIGGTFSTGQPSVSGYLINTASARFKYFRYVGSNNTTDNIFGNTSTYWKLTNLNYCDFVKIEGVNRFNSLQTPKLMQKVLFSGTVYGDSATTSANLSVGSTSQINYGSYLDTLSLPYSENIGTITLGYMGLKTLIISDASISIVSINNPYVLENLHIGANIYQTITATSRSYDSLKNVTVSNGAFGRNTTAITIDFASAHLLTRESALNMFNNFADRTGMEANILKLPTNLKSTLSDEEKAILTNKNWTLS